MLKVTDQYFWNCVFLLFFVFFLVMSVLIISGEQRIAWESLTFTDLALMTLASWRLTELVSREHLTAFFREQWYDVKRTTRGASLELPQGGFRRALLELLYHRASIGLGMTLFVAFFYLLTEYAVFPVFILAVSSLVTLCVTIVERLQPPSRE